MSETKYKARNEPLLWVSRVALFEGVDKAPFRDVTLRRGVNVVWAEDPDEDGADQRVAIVGHSTGKTTFCRLIRYCLGEPTFGTKEKQQLIREVFPFGYVGAEVHVNGRVWAVARPIGNSKVSYAAQGVVLEDLLGKKLNPHGFDAFEKALDGIVDKIRGVMVTKTEEFIQWQHLLAWCTRDQETRFQTLWDWRSTRSQHEGPQFKKEKAGNLFLMRAALDLFSEEELRTQERLNESLNRLAALDSEIAEAQKEPAYWCREITRRLKEALGLAADAEVPLDGGDMFRKDLRMLVHGRVTDLGRQVVQTQQEEARVKVAKANAAGQQVDVIVEIGRLKGQQQAHTVGKLEPGVALSDHGKVVGYLRGDHDGEDCLVGGVSFGRCHHLLERRARGDSGSLADVHAWEQEEARREQEEARLGREMAAAEERQRELQTEIVEADRRLQELPVQRVRLETMRDALKRDLERLEIAEVARQDPAKNESLQQKVEEHRRAEGEVRKCKERLAVLVRGHDENKDLLYRIYHEAVRRVLSEGYSGQVTFQDGDISFGIRHGPTMSGEAVETLSVLIADISAMMYSATGRGWVPGFLLHDSPREADLSGPVYRNLFRYALDLERQCPTDACPFQYIITTTSAPPKSMRGDDYVKLHLSARQEQTLLLGRNVARVATEETML